MMKKQNNIAKKKQAKPKPSTPKESEKVTDGYDSENETGTFSSWLRSGEGTELMKLFVITNSIIVFLTMSWPHLKEMIGVIYSFFYDEES